MLNKVIKNSAALVLSLALLIPVQILGMTAQERDPMDKISTLLLDMEHNEDYLDVTVDFYNPESGDAGQQQINEFLSEVGLSEDRVLLTRPFQVLATNEEIYNMAANDKVSVIYGSYYPDFCYVYTGMDAVNILRIVAGSEDVDPKGYMGVIAEGNGGKNKVYDLNQDCRITARDAYIVLRAVAGVSDGEYVDMMGPMHFSNERKARLLDGTLK